MLLDSWHAIFAASAGTAGSSAGVGRSSMTGPSSTKQHPKFSSMTPPPGCPMHQPDGASSGSMAASPPSGSGSASSNPLPLAKAASTATASSSSSSEPSTKSWSETLNPLNMMPFLSNSRASEKQKAILPTERTVSTIPRSGTSPPPGASPYDKATSASEPAKCPVAHGGEKAEEEEAGPTHWEYPSPQQFYNALVRKGWETPEEHVEAMVTIHNWLNEAAWQEVLEWERLAGVDPAKVELARFQGKPGTLSPKARIYNLFGKVMPSTFHADPPFDRHDWIVRRPAPTPDSKGEEVRYIIDYYSVPEHEQANPDDEPEFVLDIRPALDSAGSAWVRCSKTWDEYVRGRVPGKGSGAASSSGGVTAGSAGASS
ncbi:hypothetical protein CF327_g5057 [Tilletia walkeri]|nr:hypothetical protein CF327_g5057 [Tilletia walkeri]